MTLRDITKIYKRYMGCRELRCFWSRVGWFANTFHEWRSHELKLLVNHLTSEQKPCYSWRPIYYYTPASTKLKGGYTGITLSVCPLRLSVCPIVRLSVCGQNRVRSVSSTILFGSISYLHILSSNLCRCVACNARFKICKFEILAIFLNL